MSDHVVTEELSAQHVQQAEEAEQLSTHELQQQEFKRLFSSATWGNEGSRSRTKRPSICESVQRGNGETSWNENVRLDALVWNFQRCAMSPGGMLERCVCHADIL